MKMVIWRAEMLSKRKHLSLRALARYRYVTYHWHLPAFGALVLFVTKTLSHDTVDAKVAPEKHAHLAVLAENPVLQGERSLEWRNDEHTHRYQTTPLRSRSRLPLRRKKSSEKGVNRRVKAEKEDLRKS
jgi:hypothetical protein